MFSDRILVAILALLMCASVVNFVLLLFVFSPQPQPQQPRMHESKAWINVPPLPTTGGKGY